MTRATTRATTSWVWLALVLAAGCSDGGRDGSPAAGSDAGGAGDAGDVADAGDASWPELPFPERVVKCCGYPGPDPVACAAGDQCAVGQSCFRLTQDIAFCDASEPEEATTCADPSMPGDDCACPGVSCREDQRCVASEITCSCAPSTVNRCVDAPCSTPADCPEGSVCRPTSFIFDNLDVDILADGHDSRCMKAACQSDSDCTRVPHGRCGVVLTYPSQGGEVRLSSVQCFYAVRDGECPLGTSMLSRAGGPPACVAP